MAGFGEVLRLRGLEKVNSEALMIASGQNVKRLVAFGSRAPRRVAQVALCDGPKPAVWSFMESADIAADAFGS